jgi:hypothetical protein
MIGSWIPEPLWSAAVKLAEVHGIHLTAKALGVDYYSLQKRLEEKSASAARAVAPVSSWRCQCSASADRLRLP